MRITIGDVVKYEKEKALIVAEWDDNRHVDIEIDGKRYEGVNRSDLEYIGGTHV